MASKSVQKKLAQQLAREASQRHLKDMQETFDTFKLNPSPIVYDALRSAMDCYQESRNIEHSIAEWEDGS